MGQVRTKKHTQAIYGATILQGNIQFLMPLPLIGYWRDSPFAWVGDFVRIPQLLTRKTHACQAQMPMKGGSDAPVFILKQASKLAADLRK